ncbi:nucleoid-associated protein, partial [Clostridioides difficile]
LVGLSGMNDEYHLRVLDKDAEKEEANSKFVTEFLNATKVKDDKYKTKMFKAFVDSYIAHLYSDMKQGEDVRGMLLYMLREKQKLDIDEFADKAIKDDLKDSFKDHIEEKGIESFNIDKKWVEKNLKNRHIKTDTGFEIKGKMDDFEDFMKYGIRHNGNGTIDIVIKNVHFYNEK